MNEVVRMAQEHYLPPVAPGVVSRDVDAGAVACLSEVGPFLCLFLFSVCFAVYGS